MELFLDNWAEIVLALVVFIDVIVSLTPTKKDDQILGYVKLILNAVTGRSKRKQS